MFVCICAAVPDHQIRSCIAGGACTIEEVGDACGAGTGCGSCHDTIDTFLTAAADPTAGLARSA